MLRKLSIYTMTAFVATSASAQQKDENVLKQYLESSTFLMLKTANPYIFDAQELLKVYSKIGARSLWTLGTGAPSPRAMALRNFAKNLERHGLPSNEYWTEELETQMSKTSLRNWVTFELAMTDLSVRIARDLYQGRVEPEQIEKEFKLNINRFDDHAGLGEGLARVNSPQDLYSILDSYAPPLQRYRGLSGALAQLIRVKQSGAWKRLGTLDQDLKLGVVHPMVGAIRERLGWMGYQAGNSSNEFDYYMLDAVKQYQASNGLVSDGVISKNGGFMRSIDRSIDERINQVEMSMEKLRFLPRHLDQMTHVFVNTAIAELRVYENGRNLSHYTMKTIVGRPSRRTPAKRDTIRTVELNPEWNVPKSIMFKDKIPAIQKNPNYLAKNNMVVIDEIEGTIVDPSQIDWHNPDPKYFQRYYLRQGVGEDNALGSVKFPLNDKNDQIYLHDTNEKTLFASNNRHYSSGCVRLERPFDFAAYLLRNTEYGSAELLKQLVPPILQDPNPKTNRIRLAEQDQMPVYLIYLTAELSEDGRIRLVDDVYGQDERFKRSVKSAGVNNEVF